MAQIEAHYHPDTYTLTYLVWDPETMDAVIIDPVLDYSQLGSQTTTKSVERLVARIEQLGLKPKMVLETHAHADHLTAAQYLKAKFEIPVGIGEHIKTVQKTFKGLFELGENFATDGRQFDRLLADGETVAAGSLQLSVIHTPGHTPACVSYHIDDAVFTGDALFMDDYGTGRCDFPGGSAEALYDSIHKLYALPDDTRVFVGHDYQPGGRALAFETTIGTSKRRNPQLGAETTKEQFVKFREGRDAGLAAPRLLFQSVQVNADAGRLPAPSDNGVRYLKLPLSIFHPTDDLGRIKE